MNGLQVSGSPFEVDVSAGPPRGANATVWGSALALATAGKNASFYIQVRSDNFDVTNTRCSAYSFFGKAWQLESWIVFSTPAARSSTILSVLNMAKREEEDRCRNPGHKLLGKMLTKKPGPMRSKMIPPSRRLMFVNQTPPTPAPQLQARDEEANPTVDTGEEEEDGGSMAMASAAFNVTLTRIVEDEDGGDEVWDEDGAVYATVEHLGDRRGNVDGGLRMPKRLREPTKAVSFFARPVSL